MSHLKDKLQELKKFQEDAKKEKKVDNQQLEVNGLEEFDKELPKTEIMQESLEKQLAEEREEKADLEKTYYRYYKIVKRRKFLL